MGPAALRRLMVCCSRSSRRSGWGHAAGELVPSSLNGG